jgi:hypothetical protein
MIEPWPYFEAKDTTYINNEWTAQILSEDFREKKIRLDSLYSWTDWGDEKLKSYCGKVKYRSHFSIENLQLGGPTCQLVFEDIRETAEVYINGHRCGTVWSFPLQLSIPSHILKKNNIIEIIVQNLSANRIKMIDSQNPQWKKFYDINFVDIQYKPFNASNWNLTPSGLIGDIRLIQSK